MEEWYRYIEAKLLKVRVGERVVWSRDEHLSVIARLLRFLVMD